jgi:alginate O-acetyltransferase complex protein AlgI
MTFLDLEFWLIIVVVLFLYYGFKNSRYRQYLLLFTSFYVYSFHAWYYLPLLLLSTYIDYLVGIKLEQNRKFYLLLISIFSNLSILFIFKYYNFFSGEISTLFDLNLPIHEFLLPIGLSFYTFQTMSYAIDVYRGRFKAEKEFVAYALYVSFFAQLVAGPIERASKLLPQMKELINPTVQLFSSGILLIFWGLFLKLVLADNLHGIIQTTYFSEKIFSAYIYWLISFLALLKVYFDFMAYSEMARGVGRLFGIQLSLNFNRPLLARNLTHFWSRWHITLTNWLRDYVFKSMLSKRPHRYKILFATLLTLTLVGFWHGASWNMILFGLYSGIAIIIYKLLESTIFFQKINKFHIFSRSYMLLAMTLSSPFFMIYDTTHLFEVLSRMFSFSEFNIYELLTLDGKADFIISFSLIFTIVLFKELIEEKKQIEIFNQNIGLLKTYFVVLLLSLAILFLGKTDVQEFVYFAF